jgi:hypothetical protein
MRRIAQPGLAHKGRRVSRCYARVAGSASAVSGEQLDEASIEQGEPQGITMRRGKYGTVVSKEKRERIGPGLCHQGVREGVPCEVER